MEQKKQGTDRPVAIHYALQSNITDFLITGDSTCLVNLTGDWKLINHVIGSIDLQEDPPEETAAGLIYSTKLKATVAGHDKNDPALLTEISGRKVVIRITYKSGLQKIIGNVGVYPKIFIGTSAGASTMRNISVQYSNTKPNLFLQQDSESGSGGTGI